MGCAPVYDCSDRDQWRGSEFHSTQSDGPAVENLAGGCICWAVYFLMIMSTEEKLYMQSPFFIPDESIMEALKATALAGVDVQLMFTPQGSTYQIPYRAAHDYFKDMVEAGAKVYLYEAGYFHPKTLNIDNTVISIGTANMDIRSFIQSLCRGMRRRESQRVGSPIL